jgi:hypothetical protein
MTHPLAYPPLPPTAPFHAGRLGPETKGVRSWH